MKSRSAILNKLYRLFFIFILAAAGCAKKDTASAKTIFKTQKISDACLHELARPGSFDYARECWVENNCFDMHEFMRRQKKDSASPKKILTEKEEIKQWLEEKYRGTLSAWEYIGAIDDYAIVRTAINGDTWRNYDLIVVHAKNGILAITDHIYGLKNFEILSARIDNDTIVYSQNIDRESLLNIIKEESPDQWEKVAKRDEEELFACGITYASTLNKQGKISSTKMLSYE